MTVVATARGGSIKDVAEVVIFSLLIHSLKLVLHSLEGSDHLVVIHSLGAYDRYASSHSLSELVCGSDYAAVLHGLYRSFISYINLNPRILITLQGFRCYPGKRLLLFKSADKCSGLLIIGKLGILEYIGRSAGINFQILVASYGLCHSIQDLSDYLGMNTRLFLQKSDR